MAVTATNITTSGSGTNATSYATASVSPVNGRFYLLSVATTKSGGGSPATPTLSGASMTWTQVTSVVDSAPSTRTTMFRGVALAASSGALTIDFGGETQEAANWSLVEFTNVDTSGTNGSNGIVQSTTNSATAATSLTVTLSAFSDTRNATFGAIGKNGTAVTSPGSGFTEIGESNTDMTVQTQFKATNDTGVDWSWSGGLNVSGIAVELNERALGNTVMAWG